MPTAAAPFSADPAVAVTLRLQVPAARRLNRAADVISRMFSGQLLDLALTLPAPSRSPGVERAIERAEQIVRGPIPRGAYHSIGNRATVGLQAQLLYELHVALRRTICFVEGRSRATLACTTVLDELSWSGEPLPRVLGISDAVTRPTTAFTIILPRESVEVAAGACYAMAHLERGNLPALFRLVFEGHLSDGTMRQLDALLDETPAFQQVIETMSAAPTTGEPAYEILAEALRLSLS